METDNLDRSPALMDWVTELAQSGPDYEIDSDGHWTPRSPEKEWSDAQMEAAEAAYQMTLKGLEPCEVCQSRKTFCYQCDQHRRHNCAQNKRPECSQNSRFELRRLGLL